MLVVRPPVTHMPHFHTNGPAVAGCVLSAVTATASLETWAKCAYAATVGLYVNVSSIVWTRAHINPQLAALNWICRKMECSKCFSGGACRLPHEAAGMSSLRASKF